MKFEFGLPIALVRDSGQRRRLLKPKHNAVHAFLTFFLHLTCPKLHQWVMETCCTFYALFCSPQLQFSWTATLIFWYLSLLSISIPISLFPSPSFTLPTLTLLSLSLLFFPSLSTPLSVSHFRSLPPSLSLCLGEGTVDSCLFLAFTDKIIKSAQGCCCLCCCLVVLLSAALYSLMCLCLC